MAQPAEAAEAAPDRPTRSRKVSPTPALPAPAARTPKATEGSGGKDCEAAVHAVLSSCVLRRGVSMGVQRTRP